MKVTILGSGTWADDKSFPPSVLVDLEGILVLFDCGEGIRFRIKEAGYDFTDIEHIAITHAHPDHFALIHFYQAVYVKGLYVPRKKQKDWYVYAPLQIKHAWAKIWDFYFPERQGKLRYDFPKIHWRVMKNGSKKKIGAAKLFAFRGYHGFGKVETLSYRLEYKGKVFAYIGDSAPTDNFVKLAKEANLLVCEAGAKIGQEDYDYGHFSPKKAGELAKLAKVEKLVLIHCPGVEQWRKIKKEVKRSGFKGEILLARDLMEVEI